MASVSERLIAEEFLHQQRVDAHLLRAGGKQMAQIVCPRQLRPANAFRQLHELLPHAPRWYLTRFAAHITCGLCQDRRSDSWILGVQIVHDLLQTLVERARRGKFYGRLAAAVDKLFVQENESGPASADAALKDLLDLREQRLVKERVRVALDRAVEELEKARG